MIGLGGAEFRLPLLTSLFGFAALSAVILNKAMSLVVAGRTARQVRGSPGCRGRRTLAGRGQPAGWQPAGGLIAPQTENTAAHSHGEIRPGFNLAYCLCLAKAALTWAYFER